MENKSRILLSLFVLLLSIGCDNKGNTEKKDPSKFSKIEITSFDDIDILIESMTLEEKVGQIIQRNFDDVDEYYELTDYNIGSVLSGGGGSPTENTPEGWVDRYNSLQEKSMESSAGIPIIYAVDAVHGHNNVKNAIIFPHNIGLGAANNTELMEEIGAITAKELKATGVDWNFAPSVAIVQDIRWGRTYESYSEDAGLVESLAIPYINGLQSEGIIATAKHFIGDGLTDEGIDQGDITTITKEELLALNQPVYDAAIEAGVQTIMASFNSFEGDKMHGSKEFLTDLLRTEMGFDGLIVSDWEAIAQLPGEETAEKITQAINAGVDCFMQPGTWAEVYDAFISSVNNGDISEERLNDAVKRNLVLKFEAGLLDGDVEKVPGEIGLEEDRAVARQAVSESMVLLKNDNNVLPLEKGTKVYLTGPASDNLGIQCGGWTITWQGFTWEDLDGGTSIKDAFETVLSANGGELVSDITEADVAVLVIGERPYTEGAGDAEDLSLINDASLVNRALVGNIEAIAELEDANIPVVTLLVAGRPLLVYDYLDQWDSLVMTWLPGTEGLGITDVLFGDQNFTGKLPVTWPKSFDQSSHTNLMDDYNSIDHQFKFGDGLEMSL